MNTFRTYIRWNTSNILSYIEVHIMFLRHSIDIQLIYSIEFGSKNI